jgi:hypothetical protein
MDEGEAVYFFVAMTVVVLATVSAWIESRLEKRDAPDYLKRLRQEPRYREHVARGPVVARRSAGRRRRPRHDDPGRP